MKQFIERIGKKTFVVFTWSILTIVCFGLFALNQLTDNIVSTFGLSFLIFFGSMAYGFFYFQAFPSHRLPTNYYQKKAIETKFLYTVLGVELFRRFLINSPFRKLNQRVYLKGRKDYITIFLEETKRSETSHIIGLIVGIIFTGYFILQQHISQFYFALFFNTLLNIYPILLQRFNRNLRIKVRV
jgi:hypothetical protein